MALGHTFKPIFRVTPEAGAPYTLDVSGYRWLPICQPSYELIVLEKEGVNYNMRTTKRGYRVGVHQEFVFVTPSTEETQLSDLVIGPAADPDTDPVIEITLDNGTVWREAVMTGHVKTTNLQGKNIGVRHVLDWICTRLIPKPPATGSGSW